MHRKLASGRNVFQENSLFRANSHSNFVWIVDDAGIRISGQVTSALRARFYINMTRYLSLRVFLICLIACAALVLGAIWFQTKISSPFYFQTIASLFVVGLASFLIWFSLTLIIIRDSLLKNSPTSFLS